MYESITQSSLTTNFPRVPLNLFNRVGNIVTGGLFIFNWLYPFYNLQVLPRYVALLYNVNGNVLLAGSKVLLMGFSLAGTICLARLYKYSKSPETLNYPFKVTEKNYVKVYEWARGFFNLTGLFSQLLIFANHLLVVNGQTSDKVSRSKWIRNGVIGFALVAAAAYGGFTYILKNYILDENQETNN